MYRLVLVIFLFMALPTGALAAPIIAAPALETISIGSQTTLRLDLVLDAGENASILELKVDLVGLGVVAEATLEPCSGWGGLKDGAVGVAQATVSCTAGVQQEAGTVLSAELWVTGLRPGTFEVVLADGTFAQRDTNTLPFVDEVVLAPAVGTSLATVTVVPEPSTALLLGSGLIGLARATRTMRRPQRGRLPHAEAALRATRMARGDRR